MKTYRVAIVGLGRMGSTIDDEHPRVKSVTSPRSVAEAAQASDRLELIAGSDLIPEKREAFEERWGVKAVYEDYLEMVEKERPDLVAICTTATGLQKPGNRAPSADFRGDSHAELTRSLADSKVPMLYVEKAMACSMQAADEALEACQRNGTTINVGVLRRFRQQYRMMREAIERGEIGDPLAAVHIGASSLMHGHIHSIDTISYVLGDPGIEAVRGELQPRDTKIVNNRIDADPRATFHLVMANGVEVWSIPAGPLEVEVLGTEGAIRVLNDNSGMTLRKATATGSRGRPWEDSPAPSVEPRSAVGNGIVTCLEDLVDAYESKRPALADAKQSHHMTEACIAVAESHQRGGAWVQLPMENRDLYVFHV